MDQSLNPQSGILPLAVPDHPSVYSASSRPSPPAPATGTYSLAAQLWRRQKKNLPNAPVQQYHAAHGGKFRGPTEMYYNPHVWWYEEDATGETGCCALGLSWALQPRWQTLTEGQEGTGAIVGCLFSFYFVLDKAAGYAHHHGCFPWQQNIY